MNDATKMAASHPDFPVFTSAELTGLALQLTRQIEMCGASVELTNTVVMSSDLGYHVTRFAAEADLTRVDRDIKAANLKLLVEKVLAIEVNHSDNFDPYTVRDAMELARGLKQ